MKVIRYLKAASCLTPNSQSLKYIKVGGCCSVKNYLF